MQIAFVVYPGMTVLDAIGPYEVFNCLPSRELRFVWKKVGPVVADSGRLVLGATHTFEETPQPDLVIVPGSTADTPTVMADGALLEWLRAVHPNTRFTTSVCSGAMILAAAGLLEGHRATTHWAAMPMLQRFGAQAERDERVVQSGKIWTAAGVSAGIDLALRLVEALEGQDEAEIAQLLIEYDPQPPFDAGHLSRARPEIRKVAQRRLAAAGTNPRALLSVPTILLRRWSQTLFRTRRRG
ncbi:MAG: DJ-1/PfpI family protein [Myxococcota bacterium]